MPQFVALPPSPYNVELTETLCADHEHAADFPGYCNGNTDPGRFVSLALPLPSLNLLSPFNASSC